MTVITIKKSSVEGKIPDAADLAIAELAVNLKDRKLYTKDADGNVVALGGEAQVPGGDTPPVVDNKPGDLFWDTATEQLLYWDGTQWLPIAGDETLGITDLTDVTVAGVANGQVLAYDSGSGEWVNVNPASLSVDVDLAYDAATNTVTNSAGDNAVLTVVDAVNAGLMEPADKEKLDALPAEGPVYVGSGEPGTPSNGDIWVDLSECPPELKVWSDCSGTGQWEDIEGTPPLIVTQPVLSGTPQQQKTLTCTAAVVVGGKPPVTSTYKFTDANDVVLQNTAVRTYVLSAGDLGKTIKCAVVATDSRGTVETSLDSNALGPVVPPEAVNAPTLLAPANGALDVSHTSINLGCTAYSGTSSIYGTTTWEVSSAGDFSVIVYSQTNTHEVLHHAVFSPPLGFETVYYARCKHTSSTGIDSAYSNVNEFVTQANPVDPNIPSADMSGLRFDSARGTQLTRKLSFEFPLTFSCWVKTTGVNNWLFQSKPTSGNASKQFGIQIDNDVCKIVAENASAGTITLDQNKWCHIVGVWESDTATVYVNGQLSGSTSSNFSLAPGTFVIGGAIEASMMNGYLSEVYFAEEALPATAFGKTFPDGRWGPLDSSVIKDNINNAPKLPEGGANTSQVWSSSAFTVANNGTENDDPLSNWFDGSLLTGVQPKFGNGNHITFSFNLGDVHLLEIYANGPGNNSSNYADVQVAGDDGSFVSVKSDMTNGNGWNTISSAPLDTRQIRVFSPSSGVKVNLRGLRINGRILVDTGVWDASQNWSDLTSYDTSKISATAFEKLFDGTTTNSVQANQNNTDTLIWASNVIGGTSGDVIRVYFQGNITTVAINGTERTITQYDWFTVPENYLTSLEVKHPSGGNVCNPSAIELNGAILVDAGAQWNTSQLWSAEGEISGDTLYTSGISNYRNIFDGSLSTSWTPTTNGSTPGGRQIFTFDNSIPCTKVEVYFNRGNSSVDIQVNGNDSGAPVGGDATWHTIFNTPGSNLSSVSAEYSPGASASIRSIRVDGSILVDKASFGANGFYLPFDPTNTGVNYTALTTLGSGVAVNPALPISNIYDGQGKSTFCQLTGGAVGTGLVLAPTGLTGTTVKMFPSNGADVACTLYVNGSPYETCPQAVEKVISADLTNPTSITSIELRRDSGTDVYGIYWIEVDGVTLINHNSIGVDASGNKNNFHDQNFGIGNASQVWSSGGDNSELRSGSSWENVFNGYNPAQQTSTTTAYIQVNASATLKFSSGISGDIIVCASSATSSTATNGTITIDGESQTVTNTDKTKVEYIFSDKEDVTEMIVSGGTITAAAGLEIIYIKLNGELLIDPSYLDTVTDTPLMNYAVLDSAANGNLVLNQGVVSNKNGTLSIPATGRVYFEYTPFRKTAGFVLGIGIDAESPSRTSVIGVSESGSAYQGDGTDLPLFSPIDVGDVLGVLVDVDSNKVQFSQNGVVNATTIPLSNLANPFPYVHVNNAAVAANFGQQPFVASNVTYNQETGIATVDGVEYNTLFQTWDEWATLGLFFFNENTGKTITSFELNRKYGLTAAAPDAGIYNLTFQPRARVFEYLKQATAYLPLEDLMPQLEATEASLVATQADLDTAQAALNEATKALAENLTAFAALVTRVETLENP